MLSRKFFILLFLTFALPQNAMNYLRFLAELMEVPIAIVSLGANRDQTIVIEDPIHGPKRALLR